MIESVIAIMIVLVAAGYIGYRTYLSATGKTDCGGGCSCGHGDAESYDSEDSSSCCSTDKSGK